LISSKDFSGFYRLGQIVRTHGVKGNFVILLDVDEPARYKKIKAVHYEVDGFLRSFEVSSVSLNGKQAILHINGIETMDQAASLLKKDVYLPLDSLPGRLDNSVYFHEAIGMTVEDSNYGTLGKITTIYDLPEQPVAAVDYNGKELLFPFLNRFILKTDHQNKILYVCLPDGLVEIYKS